MNAFREAEICQGVHTIHGERLPVDEVELEEDPSDRPAMTCRKSVEEPTGAVPDHLETCIKTN